MNDSVSRQTTVPAEFAGQRLDRAVAEIWSDYSRSRIRQWIESGELTLDGAVVAPRQKLRGGETIAVDAAIEPVLELAPEPIPIEILHEDADVIVVDKPAGLVVHPGAGNPGGTLLNALLNFDASLAQVPRAGLVHRLDKDTSGLLVVARNLISQQRLVGMIERREVTRVYRAVCQTALTGGGVISAPIDRNPRDRTRMAVRENGREATTRYRLIERFRAQSHVEVELETGRTHQIRVHMAHIRAPLVGDPVYGGRPRLPRRPSEDLRRELTGFPRQALHARSLSFRHPGSGEALRFESALPEDIERLLAVLRSDRDADRS
ncbi:MAG TPA: 23S rRNA pseudouridine(1911/1915/1917) synthase RluD [Gammaproteobacteria bacterium]|nr:23S rRNA pseudouridine(1911/1915/1917) synthase RluD [Gammaproteobacteria bacterium]